MYSNRLPNEAIRVISENDKGLEMLLWDLLSLKKLFRL